MSEAHSAALAAFANFGKDPTSDETRRLEILFDLAAGLVQGLLSDEVLASGLDAIDHWEWSDWMVRQNGCKSDSLQFGIVLGCYDYVFGYVKGVRKVGAGVGTLSLSGFCSPIKVQFSIRCASRWANFCSCRFTNIFATRG